MSNSESTTPRSAEATAPTPLHGQAESHEPATPADFSQAVESMHAAELRPEITLGSIRPPQRLAPFSHAIGLEVGSEETPDIVPTDTEGDAFGRLILLHDPGAEEAW